MIFIIPQRQRGFECFRTLKLLTILAVTIHFHIQDIRTIGSTGKFNLFEILLFHFSFFVIFFRILIFVNFLSFPFSFLFLFLFSLQIVRYFESQTFMNLKFLYIINIVYIISIISYNAWIRLDYFFFLLIVTPYVINIVHNIPCFINYSIYHYRTLYIIIIIIV